MSSAVYTGICGYGKNRDGAIVFSGYNKFKREVMNAKIYKLLPHKFLTNSITIWVDGNIWLNVPPQQLVDEFLGDADMALFKHPERYCIYEEAPAAAGLYEDQNIKDEIMEQARVYMERGIPRNIGMGECNMLIRRNTPRVNAFNEAWWAETCRWSNRDQLSFPVVLQQFPDLKVNFIDGNVRNHPYFTYKPHASAYSD